MTIMRQLFLIPILFLSCTLDPVIMEDDLGDHFAFCTLSPFVKGQQVLVGRSQPESLPDYDEPAEIVLTGAGHRSTFTLSDQQGVYREQPPFVPILGDSVYTLTVKFAGGHHITATTRVPGDFSILVPQPGDTLLAQYGPRQDPLSHFLLSTVEWTLSSATYFYEARVGSGQPCDGVGLVRTNYTKIYLPHSGYSNSCFPQADDYYAPMTLSVMAVDSTRVFYPNHSRPWNFPPDLDYDPALDVFMENRPDYYPEKLDFHGGKGFFNAVNGAQCDFVLHIRIVRSGQEGGE